MIRYTFSAKMGSYALCLIGFFGAVLVYGQMTAPKVCWDSRWFNESSPTATNRSEYEHQPAPVLDSICTQGKVIAAQCRDEKKEPFQTSKNDTINKYIATCAVVTGLICHPYNNSKQSCPDFAIQYGCACPTNSSTGVTSVPSGWSVTLATKNAGSSSSDSPAGSGSGGTGNNGKGQEATVGTGVTGTRGQQHGKCRSGVPKYGISLFMLIFCLVLKLLR